jgi:hypothetical protein
LSETRRYRRNGRATRTCERVKTATFAQGSLVRAVQSWAGRPNHLAHSFVRCSAGWRHQGCLQPFFCAADRAAHAGFAATLARRSEPEPAEELLAIASETAATDNITLIVAAFDAVAA